MDTKFKNMNKLFILCTICFSVNILNAQTIKELTGRHTTRIVNTGNDVKSDNSGSNQKKSGDDFIETFTPEDQTFGFSYNYSQHFPLTLSANYTYSCWSIAGELGLNLDGKKYTTNSVGLGTDLEVKNSDIRHYNPIGFLIVSPGFYCRFLSINCGIGFIANSYNYSYTKVKNSSEIVNVTVNGSAIVNGSVTTTSDSCHYNGTKCDYRLILKPSITGYIPISDEKYYITINAGYNYVPKFKELSGWSFGVGFQWVID